MLRAEEIAAADARVGCLVMGTSDLAKELHAAHTPERLPMITALGLCLLAARACGLAILDGVHLDLEDEAGFAASCRQGAELGFDGKTLIHPKQIGARECGVRTGCRGARPGAPHHRGARAGGPRGPGRGRGRRPADREPARGRGAASGAARGSHRGHGRLGSARASLNPPSRYPIVASVEAGTAPVGGRRCRQALHCAPEVRRCRICSMRRARHSRMRMRLTRTSRSAPPCARDPAASSAAPTSRTPAIRKATAPRRARSRPWSQPANGGSRRRWWSRPGSACARRAAAAGSASPSSPDPICRSTSAIRRGCAAP